MNMAEGMGFEPTIPVSQYDGLANRCLQPLGHPSGHLVRSVAPMPVSRVFKGRMRACQRLVLGEDDINIIAPNPA